MPSPRSLLNRLCWSAFTLVTCVSMPAAQPPSEPALMPQPRQVVLQAGGFVLGPTVQVRVTGPEDKRVRAALTRCLEHLRKRTGAPLAESGAGPAILVEIKQASSAIPALGEDESYRLRVTAEQVQLSAATTLGALRGLETIQQLVIAQGTSFAVRSAEIEDAPRFPWRGLMLDVCRHWLPKEVVLRNIDGMAHVKLNVLHMHLSEDQGFRVESKRHPELQQKGSDGHFFTQEELREIVRYAAERGIRVVPEFDVPGHATSWLVSHPELGSAPGPYHIERRWGVFNPVLDPTNEAVYSLLGDVFAEMADIFPDPYFHIGGDENNGIDWNANTAIQNFIRERGLHGNEGIHTYFNTRLSEILHKLGKRIVGWDEILQPGLPKTAVIHSWRGTEALAAAAQQGYQGLLSNGFYIDLMQPASEHYAADPVPAGTTLGEDERARVLGGEATMWAEWVGPETVDSRIWPRAAAVAERLWSPGSVRDVESMYSRLHYTADRLDELGLRHRAYLNGAIRALLDHEETDAALGAIRAFVDLVEPVKRYERNRLQPWHNQLMPLQGIADAARADSAPALRFARLVDAYLASPTDATRTPVLEMLKEWQTLGLTIGWDVGPRHAKLVDASDIAKKLHTVSTLALNALEPTSKGKSTPLDSAKALEQAAQSNGSAVELPPPLMSAVGRLIGSAQKGQ